uniref:SRP40_C domain-containing protein n=1 Tax=Rhodnius prolixus TaxID=13249 RepID=T1HYL2_RHOPR
MILVCQWGSEDTLILLDRFFNIRGARGSWGERANSALKNKKGKAFKHEKTKKKRGSYRGGQISTTVNSIRFDDD